MNYSPFNKSIASVTASDLSQLRDVPEGWYVEYKSMPMPVDKVAKALSSFANMYGGWYILGVTTDETTRLPKGFPGLNTQDVATVELRLREAARTSISPTLFYEETELVGPNSEIGLPEGKSIYCVRVPAGAAPPYIHRSGRIYRRIGDSSEPCAETDRAVLDELWRRSQRNAIKLTELITPGDTLVGLSPQHLQLTLCITHDPFSDGQALPALAYESFSQVMRHQVFPFNHCFPVSDGYVARQAEPDMVEMPVPTWRFVSTGSSTLTLPINGYRVKQDTIGTVLSGYKYVDKFSWILSTVTLENTVVIDASAVFTVVMVFVHKHMKLCHEFSIRPPLYGKAHLGSLRGKIPFLDLQGYVQQVEKNGLPRHVTDACFAPPGEGLESMAVLPMAENEIQEAARETLSTSVLRVTFSLYRHIAKALGVSTQALVNADKDLAASVFRASQSQSIKRYNISPSKPTS